MFGKIPIGLAQCSLLTLFFKKIYFLKYILLIISLQLSHFFPLCPPPPGICIPSNNHPQFMSMGHAYKFFGYSIFCTILNIPPFYFIPTNLYYLIPAPFPPVFLFLLPADNPPNDLHIYDSVPVLLVCLVFQIQLLIVVNLYCHFYVYSFDLLFLK